MPRSSWLTQEKFHFFLFFNLLLVEFDFQFCGILFVSFLKEKDRKGG